MAFAIANDNHCAEAEAPATLDDLSDAVDLDDTFFELKLIGVNTSACHNTSTLQVAGRRSQAMISCDM
jgi:hypothetical protein